MMDPRDAMLQQVTPTVMVPLYGAFDPLDKPGHRFLSAGNGEWLEVRRSWLYARTRNLPPGAVAKPYGQVAGAIEWLMPAVPLELFKAFAEMARASAPKEAAAWITWNELSGEFGFKPVGVRSASEAAIHFDRPRLDEGEHLVLDLHSHGTGRAFFSSTDNADDRGEVKVSVVLGHCDRERMSTVMRLCLLGNYIALEVESSTNGAITFKESNMSNQSSGAGV